MHWHSVADDMHESPCAWRDHAAIDIIQYVVQAVCTWQVALCSNCLQTLAITIWMHSDPSAFFYSCCQPTAIISASHQDTQPAQPMVVFTFIAKEDGGAWSAKAYSKETGYNDQLCADGASAFELERKLANLAQVGRTESACSAHGKHGVNIST